MDRIGVWLRTRVGRRALAIAVVSVLVTSIASIGQLKGRLDDERESAALVGAGQDDGTPVSPGAGKAGGGKSKGGKPGQQGGPGGDQLVDSDGDGIIDRDDDQPNQPNRRATTGNRKVPDFGLITQGVTDKEVTVGISYNVSGCGDSGPLEASLGASTTGDPKKAIDAYTRYINDNGGIGGRKLKVHVADDGGAGCPEKNLAAAREMVDDEKVFATFPGLHIESDYIASRHVPVFGGRDDPASLKRYGANGLNLIQEIEGNLSAWAAFGRYYLHAEKKTPCLIHPENGISGNWEDHTKILEAKLAKYGLKFKDIIQYKEDVSTAQQQSNTAAARMKAAGCDQVWFMAGNPIAAIFFTQAASQNLWYPQWTFTSYMVLADEDLGGRLQDQQQWENAVGLSTRVPPGKHPKEGNCKRIYEKYYGNDGQSEAAYPKVVCAVILTGAETMRRAIEETGVLTGNSLMVGADAITDDFYYDAHVPIDWILPGPRGPFKTKGFSHYTVVDWNSTKATYDFPEFPLYWEIMGPNKSNGQDLRPLFKRG